jgi:hypothetical protein
MSKQIDIPESLLKAGIARALKEMGAGLADGVTIGGVVGLRPDGQTVLLKGARVTVVDTPPPAGLRLAAVDGARV